MTVACGNGTPAPPTATQMTGDLEKATTLTPEMGGSTDTITGVSIPRTAPTPAQPTPSATPGIPWETLSYDEKMTACHAMPNGSTYATWGGRFFVRLPKDIYPFEDLEFVNVSGDAGAGWISNAGLPGQAFNSSPTCWSSFYELIGTGQMDITVRSAIQGVPDYLVQFDLSESNPPLPPEFFSR